MLGGLIFLSWSISYCVEEYLAHSASWLLLCYELSLLGSLWVITSPVDLYYAARLIPRLKPDLLQFIAKAATRRILALEGVAK